ncbi:hypothetical protein AS231_04095 [Enterococcus faecium]|nr:hypothetical protein AS223_03985 [Enterococcus faecium]KWY21596.1 hypothetical protein AS231_04095 [Enterococcus faecium]KWY54446.1 hypothetical protein AS243_11450 [Enterococcus faecium]KWY71579.1 hypothetical protein AS248_15465 [Enterococcus faecium]KWY72166.1 hypothetical protein AS249_01655 [Enterococcus faecium]
MRTYWYVSLNNKYPKPMKGQHRRVVMSVQMKAKYSIVEMIREATPVEIDYCKLVYCGCGRWKEDHVQKNRATSPDSRQDVSISIKTPVFNSVKSEKLESISTALVEKAAEMNSLANEVSRLI